MFYFIITTIFTIGIYFFTEIPEKINNKIQIKYKKWLRLNSMVSTRHKTKFMIYFISITMIIQNNYHSIMQYLNNSVIKIKKNTYEVTYIINDKTYKMLVTPSRGPCPVLEITNEDNLEVSETIMQYLGPNNDFHNAKLFPNFFNYKQLNFKMNDGTELTFNNSETIILQ